MVELMIAVVVISILAAIAVPSYRRHLLRTQRSDATAALLRIQSAQEKHLVQKGKYTADLSSASPAGGLGLHTISEQGFYKLTVGLTRTGYIASASAIANKGQADDTQCATFTLNENGQRGAVDVSGADRTTECWR